MKAPLFFMTVLGLSLIAYGVFSLLRHNPEFRAEVMKLLPPEYQVQLTNLVNANIDLGNRAAIIDALDPTKSTCTGPSQDPKNCKPGQNGLPPNQLPHQVIYPKDPSPQPVAVPQQGKEYDPNTASASETLNELKHIKEQTKETNKVLDDVMNEK